MQNKDIILNLDPGTKELNIRHGEAEKISYPLALNVNGLIDAPANYFKTREIDKTKAVIIVDRRNLKIVLQADPTDEYAATITGTLQVNPDLAQFNINTEKMFSMNALIAFLRMRRSLFANRDLFGDFIDKLANFKAKVTKDIERSDDNRGNKKQLVAQVAQTAMPTDFTLQMPIYLIPGRPDATFKVEIFCEFRDATTEFWFESVELAELMRDIRDEVIDEQLKVFKEYCILEI